MERKRSLNRNGGNLAPEVIAALDKVASRDARMAAYRLPIQEGKITFSAIDPKGDGSKQAYKTSFMWGPTTSSKIGNLEGMKNHLHATTVKFMPFNVTYDGKIHNGGFMPDPTVKTVCAKCSLEFTMTQTAFSLIKSRQKAFCQSCVDKKTPKGKCRLLYGGVVQSQVDEKLVPHMYDCKDYEAETDLDNFCPNVYGVFQKGNAPGTSQGWELTTLEEELVSRYNTINMEIRPLKFLQDLYAKVSQNGKSVQWKKGIPNLEDLVVAGNPINIGWFDKDDLNKYPFNSVYSRANGFYCNLPKPVTTTLV